MARSWAYCLIGAYLVALYVRDLGIQSGDDGKVGTIGSAHVHAEKIVDDVRVDGSGMATLTNRAAAHATKSDEAALSDLDDLDELDELSDLDDDDVSGYTEASGVQGVPIGRTNMYVQFCTS